jgi:hypothetical protein
MIQLSLDGKRLYATNSLLSPWDAQVRGRQGRGRQQTATHAALPARTCAPRVLPHAAAPKRPGPGGSSAALICSGSVYVIPVCMFVPFLPPATVLPRPGQEGQPAGAGGRGGGRQPQHQQVRPSPRRSARQRVLALATRAERRWSGSRDALKPMARASHPREQSPRGPPLRALHAPAPHPHTPHPRTPAPPHPRTPALPHPTPPVTSLWTLVRSRAARCSRTSAATRAATAAVTSGSRPREPAVAAAREAGSMPQAARPLHTVAATGSRHLSKRLQGRAHAQGDTCWCRRMALARPRVPPSSLLLSALAQPARGCTGQ